MAGTLSLPRSLAAWPGDTFRAALADELAQLPPGSLPLQAALTRGSHALDAPVEAVLLGVDADPGELHVRVGIYYRSVIAGCSCADDPTPVDHETEHCMLQLDIDRRDATARVSLLAE